MGLTCALLVRVLMFCTVSTLWGKPPLPEDGESRTRLRNAASLPGPGDVVGGKYQLLRRLGEGGTGVIYEAVHMRLRQPLAIKVLRPDVSDVGEVLARFEREARITAMLRSIHAARVVDVDMLPNGLPYIVMELLEGVDLDSDLNATGPMAVEDATDITHQVAEAMSEAHDLGIVHRDLKPSNLFVCRVGGRRLIKVLDFGISKMEGDSRITSSNVYFGTPCYAAPEQLRAAVNADTRSDIWSLGVILFELLTARTPFEGNAVAVIAKVAADPIPLASEFRPDLPRGLVRIIVRALQRDPLRRFQSMREMAAAMAPFGPARSAAQLVADLRGARGRLGEILISDGLLTARQLDDALTEQRRSGQLLGRVLLERNLVSRVDLLTALAKQQGITGASLPAMAPEPDAPNGPVGPTLPMARLVRQRERRSRRIVLVVLVAAVGLAIAVAAAALLHAAVTATTPVRSLVPGAGQDQAPRADATLELRPTASTVVASPPPTPSHAATSAPHTNTAPAPHAAKRFEPDSL